MLTPLSTLASQQAKQTTVTWNESINAWIIVQQKYQQFDLPPEWYGTYNLYQCKLLKQRTSPKQGAVGTIIYQKMYLPTATPTPSK